MEYARYEHIDFEARNQIGVVTFNRPQVHNAINTHVLRDLIDLFGALEHDDDVRVIVLRGSGGKAFCAGADIDEIKNNGPVEQRPYQYLWMTWFRQIETIRKPVIASVEGWAPGGGTEQGEQQSQHAQVPERFIEEGGVEGFGIEELDRPVLNRDGEFPGQVGGNSEGF